MDNIHTLEGDENNFQELYDLICEEHEYEKLFKTVSDSYTFYLGQTRKKEAKYYLLMKTKYPDKSFKTEFERFASNFSDDVMTGIVQLQNLVK